ncbi:hypothetical protein [Lacipirellula sp.]|uniref:hypothetical protein n=1 Tax=Lacipirellula sp. TaxID=2691419 RepID=UPI003D09D6A3
MTTRKTLRQLILLLAFLTGCAQNEGVKTANELLSSMQAVTAILKSVQDPASAQAAAPKLGPAYQQMIDALDKMVAYEQKNGQVRALKGTIRDLEQKVATCRAEFAAEGERVNEMKGLPAEFWEPMRLYNAKVLLAGLRATGQAEPAAMELFNQILAIYESIGAKNVVECGVANVFPSNRAETIEKLRNLCGDGAQLIEFDDPDNSNTILVVMGPVNDFDGMIKKIDFGQVTEQEKNRGQFEVALTPSPHQETLQAGFPGDATQQAGMSPHAAEAQSRAEAAQAEAMKHHEEAVARMRGEVARMGGDTSHFDSMPSIRGGGSGGRLDEPDESDPDYHKKLAEALNGGDEFQKRRAMEKLLDVEPSNVTDKEVRAKIARGFREVAFDSPFHQKDAVEGLVLWGGKHSVPLLIELMEKNSRTSVDDSIYDGLAKHPTPEGAEAVASRLTNFFDRDKAASCLKKMGPDAEEAVIEVAPIDDIDVNLFALDFLKDHGTEKCYALLQRARKSPNPQIKQAAMDAIREVRLREKEGKGEAKPAA